jgi:hypothetical protein
MRESALKTHTLFPSSPLFHSFPALCRLCLCGSIPRLYEVVEGAVAVAEAGGGGDGGMGVALG